MRREEMFWAKVAKSDGCWLWMAAKNNKGYGVFGDRPGHIVLAHRYSVILDGRDPSFHVVRHGCDTPLCVRPDHLMVGTQRENVDDAMERTGMGRKRALTAEQVLVIQRMYDRGALQREIAEVFGISRASVSRYLSGWHDAVSNGVAV